MLEGADGTPTPLGEAMFEEEAAAAAALLFASCLACSEWRSSMRTSSERDGGRRFPQGPGPVGDLSYLEDTLHSLLTMP